MYVVKRCPELIEEMVKCVSFLMKLAHLEFIKNLPSLTTIENCMRLSPHIVQAVWDGSNPML